jgi:hypothetical protein
MQSNFKINEVVTLVKSLFHPEAIGSDVLILDGPMLLRCKQTGEVYTGYLGERDGNRFGYCPYQLRKKPEPGDWETLNDEMGRPIWRPEKIHE